MSKLGNYVEVNEENIKKTVGICMGEMKSKNMLLVALPKYLLENELYNFPEDDKIAWQDIKRQYIEEDDNLVLCFNEINSAIEEGVNSDFIYLWIKEEDTTELSDSEGDVLMLFQLLSHQ